MKRVNQFGKIDSMMIAAIVIMAAVGGFVIYKVTSGDDGAKNTAGSEQTDNESDEQTKTETDEQMNVAEEEPKNNCANDETRFEDTNFGAAFCYPSAWGEASVNDAKLSSSDKGYRETILFSSTSNFAVGGVSEDWTTEVGTEVSCLDPSNYIPGLSAYDEEWHDIEGDGMVVNYATRSLPSLEGGYDITETVSDMLWDGVCGQGHKVVNGSRYKTISAAFHADFSETAGISTPKAHMDNANILFSEEQRAQLDAVLNSIEAQ